MNIKTTIKNNIQQKQSNICISLDYTNTIQILDVLNLVKNHIIMVKIHVDIIEDFNIVFINKFVKICHDNNILIFEDRKFADIGHIFTQQFTKGIYKIKSWANLITIHSFLGDDTLNIFNKIKNINNQGILLIANMSNNNNLFNETYKEKSIEMANNNKDDVVGFICQNKISTHDFLYFIPGVNRHISKDNNDQKYISPETAMKRGADVVIVGSGITSRPDMLNETIIYKKICWDLYNTKYY